VWIDDMPNLWGTFFSTFLVMCVCWTLSIRGNTIEHLGTLLGHLAISTYVQQNKRLAFVHISWIGHNFCNLFSKLVSLNCFLKWSYSFKKSSTLSIVPELKNPVFESNEGPGVLWACMLWPCQMSNRPTVHPLFQAVHL